MEGTAEGHGNMSIRALEVKRCFSTILENFQELREGGFHCTVVLFLVHLYRFFSIF